LIEYKRKKLIVALPLIRIFSFLLLLCLSIGSARAAGDTIKPAAHAAAADTFARGNKVDVIDVLKLILGLKKDPFHKKTERSSIGPFYTIIAYPGYAIATGVAGIAAVNISFRTKKNPHGNLSFFNNNFQYTQKSQIVIQSLSNFYSNDNKWQFPGDIRYLHFPTSTYGLGTNTLPSAADGIDYQHIRFYRTVLRQIVPGTFMGIGYNLDYRWDIEQYDPTSPGAMDYTKYGFSKMSTSSGPSFNFLYDTRDNNNRPTIGTYFDFHFVSYLKPLGSTSNWSSMIIDLRKYFLLTDKWYVDLAFWGYAWLTLNGKPPYLDMPSIGWDSYNNSGRGYAAGRYRGRNMLYGEAELRFDILRNGLLGLVVFGNVQTLSESTGKYFGQVQPGGGIGIRIKFNKRTSSNSALDYGFGTHNSRGFATNLNEVF
jgi:outer membrane protein assembly factor BamA